LLSESVPTIVVGTVQVELADAYDRYPVWPTPTVIVSDGAYGVGGFPGDPPTPDGLAAWYEPHVAAWTAYSSPETTLRLKDHNAQILHANQKPLRLIEQIIAASSDPGDVVWEPFGGLCSVAVASLRMGRHCYSAEKIGEYYELAKARLEQKNIVMAPNLKGDNACVPEATRLPVIQETFFSTYEEDPVVLSRLLREEQVTLAAST